MVVINPVNVRNQPRGFRSRKAGPNEAPISFMDR
jgi:hypothetical protein